MKLAPILRDLEAIEELTSSLTDDLRWLEDLAYGAGRTGEGRRQRGSDPTGETAVSRMDIRKAIRNIARVVKIARDQLGAAAKVADRVFEPDDSTYPSRSSGSLLRPGEREESISAQRRRRERGQGHGTG